MESDVEEMLSFLESVSDGDPTYIPEGESSVKHEPDRLAAAPQFRRVKAETSDISEDSINGSMQKKTPSEGKVSTPRRHSNRKSRRIYTESEDDHPSPIAPMKDEIPLAYDVLLSREIH